MMTPANMGTQQDHSASQVADINVPIITKHSIRQLIQQGDSDQWNALILIDKPIDWTSFDVVAKVRRLLRIKKVGHTGTLDPLATGLLILCLGKATKLADRIQAGEKEYSGIIRLGATTTTDDSEGTVVTTFPYEHLSETAIREAADSFIGESLQKPPMFSARKVGGQRLYKLARRGEQVEVAPRAIQIRAFEITQIDLPDIHVRITCSKGTYIRSIARDFGSRLGSGAYLAELRRDRSGNFHVGDAITIPMLMELAEAARGEERG